MKTKQMKITLTMMPIIDFFNCLITGFFACLFALITFLGSLGSLCLLSVLMGIILLYFFGKVSNQSRIKTIKNTLQGHILGILLFQQDIRILLKLQWRILRKTLVYMRYTLPSMVILSIPVLLVLIQMNLYYSARPLLVGEPAVVTVKVKTEQWNQNANQITLRPPAFAAVETEPIRIPSGQQISWRVRAKESGIGNLLLENNGVSLTKQIVAGNRLAKLSPLRTGTSSFDLFLNPGERRIPSSSAIESIVITYPERKTPVWGWNIHWIITFFVVSMLAGYAVKGLLKVEF